MNIGEVAHIDMMWVIVIAGFIGVLLAIIAMFLKRLLSQFDKLNSTMTKIDKDFGADVAVLKSDIRQIRVDLDQISEVADRVRKVENDITAVQAGGCLFSKRCPVVGGQQ